MKKYFYLFLVTLVCVSCQSAKKEKTTVLTAIKTSDINFREHVVVKGGDANYVIYEYSDVRIDDVASLAIEYCNRVKSGSRAELRDIYMYKNHKRRATFDCNAVAQR